MEAKFNDVHEGVVELFGGNKEAIEGYRLLRQTIVIAATRLKDIDPMYKNFTLDEVLESLFDAGVLILGLTDAGLDLEQSIDILEKAKADLEDED